MGQYHRLNTLYHYSYLRCIRYTLYVIFAGVWKPRKATDGSELPSAKRVSEDVHRPSYKEDHDFTVMLAVWGQFMDHDITATALSRGKVYKYIFFFLVNELQYFNNIDYNIFQ